MIVLAPAILGLAVAPSWAGGLLGFTALFAFLTRHPLKLYWGDLIAKKSYPRTAVALKFASGYLTIATFSLVGCFFIAQKPWGWPLLAALPCFAVQFWFDVHKQSRLFLAEVMGTVGVGSFAAAILLAAGSSTQEALVIWGLVSLQAVLAITYVGARLRRAHGQSYHPLPSVLLHFAALMTMVLLQWDLLVAAYTVLLGRAAYGLFRSSTTVRAQWVGVQEICYSLLHIIAAAVTLRQL